MACNLKTMKLLECVLIGVCMVFESNTVSVLFLHENTFCGYSLEVLWLDASNEYPQ